MTEATPRPWQFNPGGYPVGNHQLANVHLPAPEGEPRENWRTGTISAPHDSKPDYEEAVANAAYIVTAANAHDALVEALEAVEWVEHDRGFFCPAKNCKRSEPSGHTPDCQLAKALSLARGGLTSG